MATSVMDLVFFHAMEINLYNRLVRTMGADKEMTKQVIALWLWMESIGYPELVRHIYTYDDNALKRVVAEGEACVEALHPDMDPAENNDIPITASLAEEPINLRFFRYNRDAVIQGTARVSNTVCDHIFDENVMRIVERDANDSRNNEVFIPGFPRSAREGTSRQPMEPGFGDFMPLDASYQALASLWVPVEKGLGMAPPLWSSLNPFAKPWAPFSTAEERLREGDFGQEPEDHRSMFLTFSRGYPLTKEDVVEFFTSRWGNCINKVTIEKPLTTDPPMFGRIVFNTASIIPVILGGQLKAKFVVKGKHLWVRMYVPKKI